MALARTFEDKNAPFPLADKQAVLALLSFNAGAFIGRLGDRIGAQTRVWMVSGTVLQALMTMAASLAIWKSGEHDIADDRSNPSWTTPLSFLGLALMSASLGLQG